MKAQLQNMFLGIILRVPSVVGSNIAVTFFFCNLLRRWEKKAKRDVNKLRIRHRYSGSGNTISFAFKSERFLLYCNVFLTML